MVEVHPFRLLGASELAHLEALARRALAEWAGAWLRAPAAFTVSAHPAEAATTPAVAAWVTCEAGAPRCHAACERGEPLERLLFGAAAAGQPSSWGADAARAALGALAAEFVGAPAGAPHTPQAPDPAEWRRGAGAALLRCAWDGGALALLVNGAATRLLLAQRPQAPRAPQARPVDARGCVGRGRVALRAWTGSAEVDIATLRSLAVGDVIRLDLRIDEPLRLSIDGLDSTRRAYLGSSAARRALRLTRGTQDP